MYETVIWATDGSEGADLALKEALQLTELTGGRLVAAHCDQRLNGRAMAWPALPDEEDRRIKIRRQVDELRASGVEVDLVLRRSHHDAADVIAEIAAEFGADVIVCGTRGLGAFTAAFVGSVGQRLLHVAPCPVLVVRETTNVPAAQREKVGA